MFFAAGQAHHGLIERLLASEDQREVVVEITEDDITVIGTMDAYTGYPVEIKTSRKWTVPEIPPEVYIEQLESYCALKGKTHGRIFVLFLTPGRNWKGDAQSVPTFKIWDVWFTAAELRARKERLFEAANLINIAIDAGDHTSLPLCPPYMCGGKDRKGKPYVSCPYYESCKPDNRYPESRLR